MIQHGKQSCGQLFCLVYTHPKSEPTDLIFARSALGAIRTGGQGSYALKFAISPDVLPLLILRVNGPELALAVSIPLGVILVALSVISGQFRWVGFVSAALLFLVSLGQGLLVLSLLSLDFLGNY